MATVCRSELPCPSLVAQCELTLSHNLLMSASVSCLQSLRWEIQLSCSCTSTMTDSKEGEGRSEEGL